MKQFAKKMLAIIVIAALIASCNISYITYKPVIAIADAEMFAGAATIYAGDTITAEITKKGAQVYYKFVPGESDTYVFYSSSDEDTYGYLYDSEGNVLTTDDDTGNGNNFKVQYFLEAATTYYFGCSYCSEDVIGAFDVTLVKIQKAESIKLDKTYIEGNIFENYYFGVYFSPEGCAEENYTFSSSNEEIAYVTSYGNLTFRAPGTAVITVTSASGLTDSAAVIVKEPIELTEENEAVFVFDGDNDYTMQTFRFTPEADGQYLFISLSDYYYPSAALYDSNGNYLGSSYRNNGDFNLRSELTAGNTYYLNVNCYNDEYDRENFNVKVVKLVPAESMEITDKDSVDPSLFNSFNLETTFGPEYSIRENVTWSSSDESVATVDDGGYVVIRGTGDVTITATSENGLTDSVSFTVKLDGALEKDKAYRVSPEESSRSLVYSFTPDEDGIYSFSSASNSYHYAYLYDAEGNYLQSNSYGGTNVGFRIDHELTAGSTYYLRIQYSYYSDINDFIVKVLKLVPAEAIEINTDGYKTELNILEKIYLSASYLPENAINEEYTWSTDNENVLSVQSYGRVRAIGSGTATVTVTSESGLTDSIEITVKEPLEIILNENTVDRIGYDGNGSTFKFVPENSGYYEIYSNSDGYNNYAVLYDQAGEFITETPYGNGDFKLQYNFEGGKTYYIKPYFNRYNTGGHYSVSAKEIVPATGIHIDKGNAIGGYVNTSDHLSVVFEPDNAIIEDVRWTSGDETIVSVDDDGYVYYNSIGTSKVTAVSESGLTAECTVEVKDYPIISLGETAKAGIETEGRYAYYKFIPEKDGYYVFYSNAEDDTYGYIYDIEMNELTSDDDSGVNNNFKIKYKMNAGETYILAARYYSSSSVGSFDVTIEETRGVTGLEVRTLPTRLDYVEGYVDGFISLMGLSLRVTWSDGTITDWSYNDSYSNFIEDEWLRYYVSYDSQNVVCLECGEAETSFTVNILENKVVSIEVFSGKMQTFTENQNGYIDNRYNPETGEYEDFFYYHDSYPSNIVVKINYSDGTSETASVGDYINGYEIYWNDDQYNNPWKVGNDNFVVIGYLGSTVKVPVTVIADTVKDIEIIRLPDKAPFDAGFFPDITGLIVRINYKDGAHEDFEISEYGYYIDTYNYNEIEVGFYLKDGYAYIRLNDDGDYELQYNTRTIRIDGIKNADEKKITDVEVSNVSAGGDGMEVTLIYDDGASDVLTIDLRNTYYNGCMVGNTDKGLVLYSITERYDGDLLAAYIVDIFGFIKVVDVDTETPTPTPAETERPTPTPPTESEIPATTETPAPTADPTENATSEPAVVGVRGDVDNDGVIDAQDALSVLKHAAMLELIRDELLWTADVTDDGLIDAADALKILKFAAKIINEL